MNFVDHSRGHKPAKKGDQWSGNLYHNRCGKKVSKHYSGWSCSGPCSGGWHPLVMEHFNDDAMATRFHIRVDPDEAEYVIVWRVDDFSKRQYSTVVRKSEVLPTDERFRL